MSDNPPDQVPNDEPESIFSGVPEEPDAGAQHFDEATVPTSDGPKKEVTDDGHLKVSVPTGDIDPFDHSAEQEHVRGHEKSMGTAPPPMPDTREEPARNPALMQNATDPLQEEMERRFSQEFGDLKVEVTQEERDNFVRAAVHDEEFIMDIELEGPGVTVKVAVPPDEFTVSASAAVNAWGKADFIDKDSDLQWLLAFQQIHAWFQVRAINGEPTEWAECWADGIPPMSEIRAFMRKPENFETFFRMNAVRWRMILDASRIAELKYKICLQNWKDRSFFDGADTD